MASTLCVVCLCYRFSRIDVEVNKIACFLDSALPRHHHLITIDLHTDSTWTLFGVYSSHRYVLVHCYRRSRYTLVTVGRHAHSDIRRVPHFALKVAAELIIEFAYGSVGG
jgi:hypothetical protein